MPLVTLILALALVGFLLWLILTYIPMPEPFKKVLVVLVIVVLVIWLMQLLGVVGPAVPRLS